MDKNTITGLVLIGIVLVVFSILSTPSQEQQAAQQRYYDSIARIQQQAEELKQKTETALANEKATMLNDSSSLFFPATHDADSLLSIRNNLVEVTLSTKGGVPYSAILKEF